MVFSVVQKLVGINVVLLINMQVLIFYVLCFTKPIHAQKQGSGGLDYINGQQHKWDHERHICTPAETSYDV